MDLSCGRVPTGYIEFMPQPSLIPVVAGQALKRGFPVYSGSIEAGVLVRFGEVPYRDALKRTGYQRRPQMTRVNAFAAELTKGQTDVPTSILLNVRDVPLDFWVEDSCGNKCLRLSDEKTRLFIVDGQHRFLAFRRLVEENADKWSGYKLQFVLMIGADLREEINQFYVVNTTAKSVKTDLALDLLKHRAETDGLVMQTLDQKGQRWKVEGQSIVDTLYKGSNIWAGIIQLANEDRAGTIIPAASFVTSLKSLLSNSPFFSKLSHDQKVNIIDAYWSGIRLALREPFDGKSDDYALQKGVGVTAMHEILPTVLEILRSSGRSVFDADAYKDIMQPVLNDLSGDNTSGENVSGAEFWLTAPKGGAAGSYSSSAGKRVLLAKLKSLLPEMDVE